MPNIKSAIKRVSVNEKKRLENKGVKSKISTYTKKYKSALDENDFAKSEELLKEISSILDNAASKNIIHKNSASRKIAHLSKLLDDAKKLA